MSFFKKVFFFTDPVVELNDDDLGCISSLADSVRFTAKIVDVPCNEMNVDTFIQV